MVAWFMAHWQDAVLALLAIDAVLIPLFPQVGFLVSVKNFLTGFAPKTPPPAA